MILQQLKNESIECKTSGRELKQPVFELFCSWFGGWLMTLSRGMFVVCVVDPFCLLFKHEYTSCSLLKMIPQICAHVFRCSFEYSHNWEGNETTLAWGHLLGADKVKVTNLSLHGPTRNWNLCAFPARKDINVCVSCLG